MERRAFIKLAGNASALALLAASKPANALVKCTPSDFRGVQQCEAGISSSAASAVTGAVDGQHMDQWCWAACIETVFRYYGYVVPQDEIVRQTWGSIVNLPGQPHQILANLNRRWVDAAGRPFSVSGDVYSANVLTAAQDLASDMPLIIGTQGHAMVLTSLTYLRNQAGAGDVTAAIVRDPWPGRGRRVLTAQEWYSTSFLARIRVW